MTAYELGKVVGMGKQADLRSWFAGMMSGPPPQPKPQLISMTRPPGAKPSVPTVPGAPVQLPMPVKPMGKP